MRKVLLFLVMCFAAGTGGVGGSILGNSAGRTGLVIGAVLGGLIGVTAGTRIATWRGWIRRDQAPRVQAFSSIGFLVAAAIAGTNLWTPLIPIASTWIVGIAALIASAGKESAGHSGG